MQGNGDYISREAFKQEVRRLSSHLLNEWDTLGVLAAADRIPAADVLPRDEAIKMGAELAEMHGSDATSQQLEEAYLKGVEDGMTRRDVRPVVKATWIVKEMQALFPGMDEHPVFACSECGYQIYDVLDNVKERHHFCPNCGADMREEG